MEWMREAGKIIIVAVGICAVMFMLFGGIKTVTEDAAAETPLTEVSMSYAENREETQSVSIESVLPAAEEPETSEASEPVISEEPEASEESEPAVSEEPETSEDNEPSVSEEQKTSEESEPSVPEESATWEESQPPIVEESETSEEQQQEAGDICSAQGHDFRKGVWETATCLKGGFYNNICQRCGLTESVTEEPLPHDVEDIVIQEGNCMEDTVIRHVCRNCGQQVQSDTRYTPQTHHWMEGIVDGSTVSYCEWCGVVQ